MDIEPVIRLVVATREDRDGFFSRTPTGRSYVLHNHPFLQISLYDNNSRGLPEIYNEEIEKSKDDPAILVFAHDDIYICDYWWVDQVRKALTKFDLVGLAGGRRRVPFQPTWVSLDANGNQDDENLSGVVGHGHGFPPRSLNVYGAPCQEVKLLDGLMLVARSETFIDNDIRFDERLSFHFYDLDVCREFERQALRIGTWCISVVHEIRDTNSYTSDDWSAAYGRYIEKWSN